MEPNCVLLKMKCHFLGTNECIIMFYFGVLSISLNQIAQITLHWMQ